MELGRKQEVVVYDQSSKEAGHLSKDGFLHILMGKLEGSFYRVSLLTGTCVCVCVHEEAIRQSTYANTVPLSSQWL